MYTVSWKNFQITLNITDQYGAKIPDSELVNSYVEHLNSVPRSELMSHVTINREDNTSV